MMTYAMRRLPIIGLPRLKRFRRGRDWVLAALTAENIGVGVHYRALCNHPYYQQALGWKRSDCPVASDIGDRTLSLPLSAALTDADVDDVIAAFRNVIAQGA